MHDFIWMIHQAILPDLSSAEIVWNRKSLGIIYVLRVHGRRLTFFKNVNKKYIFEERNRIDDLFFLTRGDNTHFEQKKSIYIYGWNLYKSRTPIML